MLRFGYHISSIHHGQKDHKCDLCEKEFSQVGTLRKQISEVHSSIHHGKKITDVTCAKRNFLEQEL